MAININAEQYGAQFRAFVEFAAQQNNPGHIARIEKPNREAGLIGLEGQPRSITAKSCPAFTRSPTSTSTRFRVPATLKERFASVLGTTLPGYCSLLFCSPASTRSTLTVEIGFS